MKTVHGMEQQKHDRNIHRNICLIHKKPCSWQRCAKVSIFLFLYTQECRIVYFSDISDHKLDVNVAVKSVGVSIKLSTIKSNHKLL